MSSHLAKVICHDEFHDTVTKYKVRERVRVRIRVRVRLLVGAWCTVYNKTLCRMQHIFYIHDVAYTVSAFLDI